IESTSVGKYPIGQLLVELKVQGDPESPITGLDALVDGSDLGTALRPHIVEYIGGIEVSSGQFDAQSQGQVPIGMAFRIEQPVTHSHPDIGQTPGEGLVPFRPAVLVEGRSGVDHRWNGEAAVESVGDAV